MICIINIDGGVRGVRRDIGGGPTLIAGDNWFEGASVDEVVF